MNSLFSMQASLRDRSWSRLAADLIIFVRSRFSSSVNGWTKVSVFLALSTAKRRLKRPRLDVADQEAHCEWKRGGERFLDCHCQTCTLQNIIVRTRDLICFLVTKYSQGPFLCGRSFLLSIYGTRGAGRRCGLGLKVPPPSLSFCTSKLLVVAQVSTGSSVAVWPCLTDGFFSDNIHGS